MKIFNSTTILFIGFFILSGCKNENVTILDLQGIWIEKTTNSDKIELEIVGNGVLYTTSLDTANMLKIDTGAIVSNGENAFEFKFSWGIKGGHLNTDLNEIEINDLYTAVFPTITQFERK